MKPLSLASRLMITLKSLDTLEFKFKHSFHKLGLYNLIDNSGSIHNSKLFQKYSVNIQSVIFHLLLTPPPDFSCGSKPCQVHNWIKSLPCTFLWKTSKIHVEIECDQSLHSLSVITDIWTFQLKRR